MDVDEYVRARVTPELQPIVAMLRELFRETAPDVKEVITYGIIGFKGRHMLAVINPTTTAITLAFSRGAEFEDDFGLLKGKGKVSKHIRIKTSMMSAGTGCGITSSRRWNWTRDHNRLPKKMTSPHTVFLFRFHLRQDPVAGGADFIAGCSRD